MKTNCTRLLHLLCLVVLFNLPANAQDLISCTSCWITPGYTFSSTTKEVTIVDMVIKNNGWNNATAFDFAVFLKEVNTGAEYEIDRLNYAGLSYQTGQNQIPITNMVIDLDNQPQVPGGTYRVQGRINDNQNAFETNYTNNTEYFGNTSFVYSPGAGINEPKSIVSNLGNYPNPVADLTNFTFTLTEKSHTILTVYDISGKESNQIINQDLGMGTYIFVFNTATLPNGIYCYTLNTNNELITRKLIVNR